VKDSYDFCPYCGNALNDNFENDWGILGRDDNPNFVRNSNPFGNDMISKMLGGAVRMLQKEMQKGMGNENFQPNSNFKLMINGKEVNLNNSQNKKQFVKRNNIKIPSSFSAENLKKFSSLPRVEPVANMKRFADKVIYEIELEGVKSMEGVIIIRLESSIEIKAVAKDKSYSKIIPVNFPIIGCDLSDGKLILEFAIKS